jgi:hypothetical protein
MDLDGNQRITLAEYLAALDENKRVAAAVSHTDLPCRVHLEMRHDCQR